MKKILMICAVIIGLNGCSEKTYTADYLMNDKEKRLEILEDCKANKQSPENCASANAAQTAIAAKIKTLQNQINTLKYRNLRAEQRLRKYPNAKHDLEAHEKTKNEALAAIAQAEQEIEKLKQQ